MRLFGRRGEEKEEGKETFKNYKAEVEKLKEAVRKEIEEEMRKKEGVVQEEKEAASAVEEVEKRKSEIKNRLLSIFDKLKELNLLTREDEILFLMAHSVVLVLVSFLKKPEFAEGVNLEVIAREFSKITQSSLDNAQSQVEAWLEMVRDQTGLIEIEASSMRVRDKGILIYNSAMKEASIKIWEVVRKAWEEQNTSS